MIRPKRPLNIDLSPINKVLKKLSGLKKQNSGYIARCPAHDDRNPSLKVSEGRDGRVLLHCHAGCKYEDILTELNLKPLDFYIEKSDETECIYNYQNEDGNDVYEIVRTKAKAFYIRRKERGKFVYNADGVTFVPYNLPNVLGAVENNKRILIVEGEKDADNLIRLGFYATTFCFGLKWQNSYAQYFEAVIPPENSRTW